METSVSPDTEVKSVWNEELLTVEEPKYFEGFPKLLKLVGITAGVSIAAYFFITILRSYLTEKVCTEVNFQHKYTGKEHNKRPEKVKAAIWNADDRKERILKNMVVCDTDAGMAVGLALDSKFVLVNAHLVLNATEMRIRASREDKVQQVIKVAIGANAQRVKFGGHEETDLFLVYLQGSNLDQMKSIRKQLRTNEDWLHIQGQNKTCTWYDGRAFTYISQLHDIRSTEAKGGMKQCYAHVGRTSWKTVDGDCGTPYFADFMTEHILMGIHTGEVGDRSFNVVISPISKEGVMEAEASITSRMNVVLAVTQYKWDNVEQTGNGGNQWDTKQLVKFGEVEMNGESVSAVHLTRTELRRSPLQNEEWDDSFLPSQKEVVVVDDKKIHPLYSNVQKYEVVTSCVAPSCFDMAIRAFNQEVPEGKGAILSQEEVLNGVDDMNRIVRKTSAGFITRYLKKADLIDETPGLIIGGVQDPTKYSLSDKARHQNIPCYKMTFLEYLEECDEKMRKREQPMLFWTSTNKDELRPVEKVKIGKTRVFENPDFILSLLYRKYFGSFINWYKNNKGFDLHHAIGIDVSLAFREIYEGLPWKDRVWDLDYTNFDGSVFPLLFEFFVAVTDKFYSNGSIEERNARHTLIEMLRRSLLIVGNTIYRTAQGNKSGNPMTDVFNSVVNAGFIYLSYASLYGEDVKRIRDHVAFLCYGDDVIGSVDEEHKDFNRVYLAECGKKLGLKITPANKTAALEPFTRIEEVTFLKAHFKPGIPFRNPLPIEVIHRELRWEKRKNHGDEEILKQRIDQAMQMILHHSEDDWVKLRNQIAHEGYIDYIPKTSYVEESRALALKQSEASPQLRVVKIPCVQAKLQSKLPQQLVNEAAARDRRAQHDWYRWTEPQPTEYNQMEYVELDEGIKLISAGKVPTVLANPCFSGVHGRSARIYIMDRGDTQMISGRKVPCGKNLIFIPDCSEWIRPVVSDWWRTNYFNHIYTDVDYYDSLLRINELTDKIRFGLEGYGENDVIMQKLCLMAPLPGCERLPLFDFVRYRFTTIGQYCGDGGLFEDNHVGVDLD